MDDSYLCFNDKALHAWRVAAILAALQVRVTTFDLCSKDREYIQWLIKTPLRRAMALALGSSNEVFMGCALRSKSYIFPCNGISMIMLMNFIIYAGVTWL